MIIMIRLPEESAKRYLLSFFGCKLRKFSIFQKVMKELSEHVMVVYLLLNVSINKEITIINRI